MDIDCSISFMGVCCPETEVAPVPKTPPPPLPTTRPPTIKPPSLPKQNNRSSSSKSCNYY